MSAAVPGRVVCPRCGENNFDTQANCWKCGSALRGGVPPAPSASPGIVHGGAMPHAPNPAAPAAYAPPLSSGGSIDPAVAVWAGIALAILFPSVAIPVGIVFLMLDDRRRAEIGRITLLWGIICFLLHLFVTAVMVGGTVQKLIQIAQTFGGRAGGGLGGGGASDPKFSEPIQFPAP